MVKFNAVVSYPIKSNGHNRTHQVVVYFDNEKATDEEVIKLGDEKIKRHSEIKYFSISGEGTVIKRDYIEKSDTILD